MKINYYTSGRKSCSWPMKRNPVVIALAVALAASAIGCTDGDGMDRAYALSVRPVYYE